MEINKYWTNKGYSSGFGDLINQISYDYTNATEPTTINWCLQPRTNRQVKRVLNFFKPNDLITHQFKSFTQTDEPPIGQHPHDYWPAKLLHKGGDYIAIWLYTKHKSKSTHHQDKVADRSLIEMMIKAFKANGSRGQNERSRAFQENAGICESSCNGVLEKDRQSTKWDKIDRYQQGR